METVPYHKKLEKEHGVVLSIDNLVLQYRVKSAILDKQRRKIVDDITEIYCENCSGFNPIARTKNDNGQCFFNEIKQRNSWQWYRYMWQGDGVNIQFDKFSKSVVNGFEILRIEFNPNKWWSTPLLSALIRWISENCGFGVLLKYDFTVDVPYSIDNVYVTTRKTYNVYKGTRYYGERNKHGHLRIYDKKAELANKKGVTLGDYTRIEYTFQTDDLRIKSDGTDNSKYIVFDDVVIGFVGKNDDIISVQPSLQGVISAMQSIRFNIGDYEYQRILKLFPYRQRQKILPYVDCGYIRLSCSVDDVDSLLAYYAGELSIAYTVVPGQWKNAGHYINHGVQVMVGSD